MREYPHELGAFPLFLMLREILFVADLERRDVVLDQIDLAANSFSLAGLETADAEVGMQAAGDALEEFLVWLRSHGKDHLFVGAEASNESIAGNLFGHRAWVDVVSRNVGRPPDLAGSVTSLLGPVPGGHACELPVEEDETLGQIVIKVATAVFAKPGEGSQPDAGLCPVGLRSLVSGIAHLQLEIDLVIFGGNIVKNYHPIG